MRENTDSDARSFGLYSNFSPNTQSQTRYLPGSNKVIQQHFGGPIALWLKIVRQGNWFFAYKSADGNNYSYVHAVYLPMEYCIQVGMSSFSNVPGVETTATFSNIQINGGIAPAGAPEGNQLEISFSDNTVDAEDIRLFPNPASNMITLDFGNTIDRATTIVLRNKLGQLIEQRQLEIPAMRAQWDISELVDGIYLLEIHTEGNISKAIRFVKG